MLVRYLVLVGCLGLSACPNDELAPREACEQMAASVCERFYACLSPAELARAGLPSSEAACITRLEQQEGCRAQTVENTCEGNERYHADEAGVCVDQIAGLSCGQLRSDTFMTAQAAPACAKVCVID